MERTIIKKSSNKVKETWEYNRSTYNYEKESNLGCKLSWPPRPYTCSFCKREFRCAQALGGHMNVHRRDRARLNQSIPNCDINLEHANSFISHNPDFHHPSSSTASITAFSIKPHFPPAYPPKIGYSFPRSVTSTPPSITACSSLAPPTTDESIKTSSIYVSSSSLISQSSRSKGQENVIKSTTTSLPMMELLWDDRSQHQLKGFMNENYDHRHQYYGDNYINMKQIDGASTVRLDLEIGLCSKDDLDLELRLGFS
ncbi:hypothetical protein MKX03_023167 [Papaver bracteatum]|nr:hypothetical protein MKX03_023167 [Papaver bracteatum]